MGRLDDIAKRNREHVGMVGGLGADPVRPEPAPPTRFQLPSQRKTTMSPLVVIPAMIALVLGIGFYVWWRYTSRPAPIEQPHLYQPR